MNKGGVYHRGNLALSSKLTSKRVIESVFTLFRLRVGLPNLLLYGKHSFERHEAPLCHFVVDLNRIDGASVSQIF